MFLGFYFGGLVFSVVVIVVVCQIMLRVAVPVLELLVCTTMLDCCYFSYCFVF